METFCEEEVANECAICFSHIADYRDPDEVYETKCNHTFHKECIVNWVGIGGTCPLCRKPVTISYDEQITQAERLRSMAYNGVNNYLEERKESYFAGYQPYSYPNNYNNNYNNANRMNEYHYAVHPAEYQPSGHVNFSRASEAYLQYSSENNNPNAGRVDHGCPSPVVDPNIPPPHPPSRSVVASTEMQRVQQRRSNNSGSFSIITNDGKSDRLLMAEEHLRERLKKINKLRESAPNVVIAQPWNIVRFSEGVCGPMYST